mgnify:FL=1
MKFTWIPYYQEFAEKLLQYETNRGALLKLIYDNGNELKADYLHDEKGRNDLLKDIDPFTVFGLFNRRIKRQNRINTTVLFKRLLGISAPAPTNFTGIPILNNQKSHFFGFRNRRGIDDIQNLWNLFRKVVKGEDFSNEFNKVRKQFIININMTMGLYWIQPEEFLAFDSSNKRYL